MIYSIQEPNEDWKKKMEAERKRRLRAKLTQQERQEINKKRRETRPKLSQQERQEINNKRRETRPKMSQQERQELNKKRRETRPKMSQQEKNWLTKRKETHELFYILQNPSVKGKKEDYKKNSE
jgi:hypothetical protein